MSRATSYHKVTGPLTLSRAEVLVKRLTDGLLGLKNFTGEFSSEDDSGMKNDDKTWAGWDWPQGVALTVLYQHCLLDPSSKGSAFSRQTAIDWYESQWELTSGQGAPKHVNSMAALYCLSSLLHDGKIEDADGKWVKWCTEWAEWVMKDMPRTRDGGIQHIVHDKENKDQLWADTLFMTVLPLARIGILLDRPEYIQEAAFQFLIHIKYLSDPATGLWTHAWQFEGKHRGHHFAKAFWARGCAWVVYAIPLFLEIAGEVLPEDDPSRRMIVNEYRRLIEALHGLQDAQTGLWHTLLDDQSSYLETSASAGFSAGIFAGIRLGLLSGGRNLPMANAALVGSIANIAPSGEVHHVSGVSPVGNDLEYYRTIPITPMPYGQALVMAALVEWERFFAMDEAPRSAISDPPVLPEISQTPVKLMDVPGTYPGEDGFVPPGSTDQLVPASQQNTLAPLNQVEQASPTKPRDGAVAGETDTTALAQPAGDASAGENSIPGGSVLAQLEASRKEAA